MIGTSGWHYQHWRAGFYPAGLPASKWLAYYAERFGTVEVNNAFYRLPTIEAFGAWAATVPDDFVVAVKASRYLTHIKRLKEPAEPVERLWNRAEALGPKLGPVLLQLPPNLSLDLDNLDKTLSAFPAAARVTVEFRHPSWWVPGTRRVLERHRAALCLADNTGPRTPLWRTAAWGYLRLHAGRASPSPCYGRVALRHWADRLADEWTTGDDLYVYFNNDTSGCAPRDAHLFAVALRRVGLEPTRVPALAETPVAARA